jgi:prepilin-type processing-associated H-X9-DG protein
MIGSLSHRAGSRRRTAFTLVELLVVTGIIAILIGLLMPVVGRMRAIGRRSECLSQMRQLGTALNAYMAENAGYVPIQPDQGLADFADDATLDSPNGNLRSMLGTLLLYMSKERRVLRCPVAMDVTWLGWGAFTEQSDTSYMGNGAIPGRRFTRIRQSSEVIIFQEDKYRWSYAWCRPALVGSIGGQPFYSGWGFLNGPRGQEYTNNHDNGGNLLFCDGHAEWRLNASLRAGDFGLGNGPGVTGMADDDNTMAVHFGINYRCLFD